MVCPIICFISRRSSCLLVLKAWGRQRISGTGRDDFIKGCHPVAGADFPAVLCIVIKVLVSHDPVLITDEIAAEELFYLGDATFFIISPELGDDIIKQINQETIAELKKVQDDLPGGFKWTSQRID